MNRNNVELIGRVGKDPEIVTFEGGGKIAKFSVATTETWKDKSGQKQERTEWHQIVSGVSVEFIERWIKKGDVVIIDGKISYRQWTDKDGTTKYSTEIRVKEIQKFWDRKQEGSETPRNPVADEPQGDDLPF